MDTPPTTSSSKYHVMYSSRVTISLLGGYRLQRDYGGYDTVNKALPPPPLQQCPPSPAMRAGQNVDTAPSVSMPLLYRRVDNLEVNKLLCCVPQ